MSFDQRRRASASGPSGLTASALNLPLEARRELALSLLWSLPRDDVIRLNGSISRLLQKDIVGSLPPELGIYVLAKLDVRDILNCRLVSKSWLKLCDEQGLWALLCGSHHPPITPRQTAWADLSLHQQLLHLPTQQSPVDEGGFEQSNLEDLALNSDTLDPDASPAQSGSSLARSTVDPYTMAGGVRGLVWERNGPGLPTHVQNTSPRKSVKNNNSSPRQKRPRSGGWDTGQSHLIPSPVLSHIAVPSASPQVNFKHLYITHRLLAKRMRHGLSMPRLGLSMDNRVGRIAQPVRPRSIDALSSIEAGGLPGHSESIYSLKLISRQMSITMGQSCPDCLPGGLPVTFDWSTSSPRSPLSSSTSAPSVSGRDWLLSASRDQTLRLWQLACPKPRVVKIFHSGHTGSILCQSVASIPSTRGKNRPFPSPVRTSRRNSSTEVPHSRLMAVSGGSDGRLCLWDIEYGDGQPEKSVEAHQDSVLCVAADDEHVVSSSKDRTIRVFDIATLERILLIDCTAQEGLHRSAINSVCLTKEYIISASSDKTIRVWCIHTGNLLAWIDATSRGIATIDFAPPSLHSHPALCGTIIAGSSDASIKVFHLVTHTRTGVDIVDALDMIPPMRDLTFREMMLAHEDEAGSDVDVEMATISSRYGDADEVTLNTLNEDEAMAELRIELAGQCWASCVCPPGLGKPDSTLCARCCNRGHTDLVRSVHLGEQVILSGSYDSTVKVWDRSSGRLLSNLAGVHTGRVFSVVGDRMRIISSGLDSRISIWDFSEGLDTAFIEP